MTDSPAPVPTAPHDDAIVRRPEPEHHPARGLLTSRPGNHQGDPRGTRRPRRPRALLGAGLAALLLTVTACSGGAVSSETDSKPTVLTTFTVLADMTRQVAGDHLQVESVTKPGAEIHEYEPTPEDIRKASRADLVIDNGMNLETWFQQFLQDSNARHVTASEGVQPLEIAEGAGADRPNPHAWMSPADAQSYVSTIERALSDLDPRHAEDYRANAQAYRERIGEVRKTLVDAVDSLPRDRRTLVTCEGAFSYLARDAGLQEAYLWPVNSDHEGTAQQIESTIRTVRERHVRATFCESTVSHRAMDQVREATGARDGGTLYVDSLSPEGGPVPTYLDLIRHDAETIARGLAEGAA